MEEQLLTTKDYSLHRLTNTNEILSYRSKMGVPEFWTYFEKLHAKIYSMSPGDKFNVDDVVIEANRDLFIKILCHFISEYPSVYLFKKNYTVFCKLHPVAKFHSFQKELTS